MKGYIELKHLFSCAHIIIKEFGWRAYVKCLWTALINKKATFLSCVCQMKDVDVIMKKQQLKKQKELNKLRGRQCTCAMEDIEPHICPYAQEINNSDEECNCCEYCEDQCAMDI